MFMDGEGTNQSLQTSFLGRVNLKKSKSLDLQEKGFIRESY